MRSIKLWWITATFLALSFIMTNGSGIYRFISMVDMFIWFIYINIFILVLLIGINIMVISKLTIVTKLPSFLTKNFLVETIAEEVKEAGLEKASKLGAEKFGNAHRKVTETLEKFSLSSILKDLFIYSGAAVLAHMLVNKYFVSDLNFMINNELLMLLAGNTLFILYYFYSEAKLKPFRTESD